MSITKNFVYNSAITVSTYIVGFVIFPYITRKLGVDNIGVIGFVDNAISYFVTILMLGAHSVGVREIAACQGDRNRITEVFSSILSFLLVSTILAAIVYSIFIFNIPQFNQYKNYFLIGYIKILFTPFVIEWLFAGSQDFAYISKRTISVRVIYAISIIYFINDSNDVWIYFLLTGLMTVVNALINLRYSRRYVNYKLIRFRPTGYYKPIAKLGLFQIIISFYSTFNYIYLRWVSTEYQVGLYYTSIKIYTVLVGLFSAYTNVVMPRISELLEQHKMDDMKKLVNKSFEALISFCIPIIICVILLSPFIVEIIAGTGFEGSTLPMMIVMPVLLIAGLNQVNGTQVLIPLHKDNVLLITAALAASVGLLGNFFLDRKYGAVGASVTVLLSEFVGCVSGYVYSVYTKTLYFPSRIILRNICLAIPYFLIYVVLSYFIEEKMYFIFSCILLFITYFFFSQYKICKNQIIINIFNKILIHK